MSISAERSSKCFVRTASEDSIPVIWWGTDDCNRQFEWCTAFSQVQVNQFRGSKLTWPKEKRERRKVSADRTLSGLGFTQK